MPGERRLSSKQAAFVRLYLSNGGNATQAYKLAYQPKGDPKTFGQLAHAVFKSATVGRALGIARQRSTELISTEIVNRYAIDQAAIAAALARLSFSEIGDVCTLVTETTGEFDENTGQLKTKQVLRIRDFADMDINARFAIAKIKQDKDGQVSIELHDKRQSLVDLARVMGLITDKTTVPIDPTTGKPIDRFQPVTLQIIRKG